MNGDDTLDWAKKPAEPGNRKRAVSKKTIEGSPVSRFCPKCALEGSVSPIQLFQINDEEALLMCKNAACTFMQSTYWQSLIVKRSVSQLTVTNRRRKSLSSRSSHVSTPTSANTDTCLQSILKSSSQSRYSVNPTSSPGISPVSNLAGVTAGSQPPFKKLVSESSLEGKERKTLVPIAPFLSGHAHSFASFETNKLEHKLQQRNTLTQQGPALSPKPTDIRKLFGADKWRVLSKRRACSLDSDSQSSSSSCYDSRPTTPDTSSSAKKVRSIVVPPETLSKLIDGSMKLEIRKTTNSGADIIFRSVKKVNSTVDYSKQPERTQLQTLNRPVSCASINSVPAVSVQEISGGDLDITPVGSLHDLVSSRGQQSDSASSHIEAINFHLQASSIKSHIEIINSHIQAINKAVGCSDLYVPIDFSHLCQKFSVDILNVPASAQEGDQNSLVSTSGHNEFQVVVDTSSFDYSSFKPVGYLDRQIIEPVLDSLESSSLISGSAEPTSDSSQCGGTQLSSSCS